MFKFFSKRRALMLGLALVGLIALGIVLPTGYYAANANAGAIASKQATDAQAARWQAIADFYAARASAAASQHATDAQTARWQAIADFYTAKASAATSQRPIDAEAARWQAMADYYAGRADARRVAAELAAVRVATAQFHQIPGAEAGGYHLVPGLDYCFDNPGVGGMGVHYIKTTMLDTNLDPLQPEAMVYSVGSNGQLQLGAVEYIVPAAKWESEGHTQPPTLLGQSLRLNKSLGVYALHAWIWQENPSGMFSDWNPKVSCP